MYCVCLPYAKIHFILSPPENPMVMAVFDIAFKVLQRLCFLLAFLYPGLNFGEEMNELTLQEALDLAVQSSPGLAEMQARSKAMSEIPPQSGSLPDPVISFNALNLPTDTFDLNQEAMTQMQFGISQTIPFPGKLGLKREISAWEAESALHNVNETRLLLLRDVKTAWWNLFYLDRALEIVFKNQVLLRQFVEIAQTKYRVGEGLQQDVLLAQLELSTMLEREINLKGSRRNMEARLNALLGRAAETSVALQKTVEDALPEVIAEIELYQKAERSRPLLAMKQNNIQAAESRLQLAEKGYFPDFNVGAFYGLRGGENPIAQGGGDRSDLFSMRMSMNVPIFAQSKQAKAVDQRTSEVLQQKYAMQDELYRVQMRIASALSDYQRATGQYQLFKTGIIPQARQTVASMLAGYQVNKVDFLNLVRSQLTLFNYETQYWRVLSEANQSLAQLEAAVGEDSIYE